MGNFHLRRVVAARARYKMQITYKKAGVDIALGSHFIEAIKPFAKGIGGFGGLYKFAAAEYKEPYLVSSTDGVGTKLKLAFLCARHNTVGIDLVAMNVNDVLCVGAEPLFFLDYIATGRMEKEVLTDVVKGIAAGCRQAGCSLVGGETAQMRGFYKNGEYDLAGFCVGVVEKRKIIDGSKIKAGDIIIGLESSGLHSNGFSLVRKVFSERELKKYSPELLKPTRIYVKPVLSLLRTTNYELRTTIKGIAHITGGAFYNKIARILPGNVNARIHRNSWVVPPIFRLIQDKGDIPDKEMYHTFNMGIGMVLIAQPKSAKEIVSRLSRFNLKSWVIGEIVKGKKQVEIV